MKQTKVIYIWPEQQSNYQMMFIKTGQTNSVYWYTNG